MQFFKLKKYIKKDRVAGYIPSQGTCLGCGPGPQWGPQRTFKSGAELPAKMEAYVDTLCLLAQPKQGQQQI